MPSSPSPPGWYDAAGQPFCTGSGTDMHMSGFTFYPADCILLLFSGWRLDSPSAFAGGVLATVALGVLTEFLTWLRRRKIAPSRRLRAAGPARYVAQRDEKVFTSNQSTYQSTLASG